MLDSALGILTDEIRARLRLLHPLARANNAPPIAAAANCPPPRATGTWIRWREHAEEIENSSGKHLRLRRRLSDLWPQAPTSLAGRLLTHDRDARGELAALAEHFPSRSVFLDLETCGFAGSTLFLAGLAWQADEEPMVDQLFARNYAEERSVLEALWKSLEHGRVLVTFNGKSFDWPMVRDRTTRHRLHASGETPRGHIPASLVHCDLLHHARRRWKHVLPDCKLQTLERYVCRRRRSGDLAGSEVPAAYHAFVRTGEGTPIGAILQHNALDVLTLIEIALRLLRA